MTLKHRLQNLRYRIDEVRGYLALSRTRRDSIRIVVRTEFSTRWNTVVPALQDLAGAAAAHRLTFRSVAEYTRVAVAPSLKRFPAIRTFVAEIAEAPKHETENPLKGARDAAAGLLTSERLRALQGKIVSATFVVWFGLKVSPAQAGVLGSYSDAAWLARGLMRSAGLPEDMGTLTDKDRWKLKVVLEPYVRGLELRRVHLEGISRPGRTLMEAHIQKLRIRRLRSMGFSPDGLNLLYPDILDREELRLRTGSIGRIRNQWVRRIEARGMSRRFENYLHLQTLISGAPIREPVRHSRFLAAVEHRHA